MILIDGKGMGSSTPNKHLYMLSTEDDIQLIYCYIIGSLSLSLSLSQGKVPLLSLEALHQLHIFIFVLALVHVIFCVSTMFLGGVRVIY